MRHSLNWLNFFFKDIYLYYLVYKDKKNHPYRWYLWNLVAGGLAGATATSIVYPLDFARTRMTADVFG